MPSMAQSMKATTTLLTRREARTSTTLTTLRTLDLTLTTMMSHLVLAMATSLGLASAMVVATIVHDSCRFDFFFVDRQQCLKYTTINNWKEIKLSKTFVLPNDQAFKLDNTS